MSAGPPNLEPIKMFVSPITHMFHCLPVPSYLVPVDMLFLIETVFLTYHSQGTFSSEKLSDGIHHLSSALIFVVFLP